MALGLRTFFKIAANVVVTSSTALVTTGLTSPIAAGQTQKFRAWILFSVGAAGGIKLQVVVPAGGTLFNVTYKLFDNVTPALITAVQVASGSAFTNALAVAGTHWIEVEGTVVNGNTAGNIDIQVAQNSSNATPFTAFSSGTMDVVKL
jgi:hypothetical protein